MEITYDSVDILSGNYKIRSVGHDSSPENIINQLKATRQDGEIIISDNFGVKNIDIIGRIVGTTQDNLETNIDSFKELVSRKDKNLDISYAGGTRRYVCRPVVCNVNRDFFNLTFAPFHIRFEVPSGEGKNTSATTALDDTDITATNTNNTFAITGSKIPKLIHSFTLVARGSADVLQVTNNDTGDVIEVDIPGLANGEIVIINEEDLTVKDNSGNALTYRGKFPFLDRIGTVDFDLDVLGSGSTLDITQTDVTGSLNSQFYDDGGAAGFPLQAQSFIAVQSGRLEKLSLKISKTGSPTGSIRLYIKEDSNGIPGDNASEEATPGNFIIAAASIPGALAFTDIPLSGNAPYLTKGVRYWIWIDTSVMTGTGVGDFYLWACSSDPTSYANGKVIAAEGLPLSTYPWEDGVAQSVLGDHVNEGQYDSTFKIYRGSGGAASHDIDWKVEYTKTYL